MIEFLNYVPVRGSVGEALLKFAPLFLFGLLGVLGIYLLIREMNKWQEK